MLDIYLFNQINQLVGNYEILDALAIFFARWMPWCLIVFLASYLCINYKKWKMFLGTLLSGVSALIVTRIIKVCYHRPRPFTDMGINSLLNHSLSSAFPSTHAGIFFALSGFIIFYNKKLGIWFLIFSFLIAISRVYTGLHWLTDVLMGMSLGIFIAILFKKFLSK